VLNCGPSPASAKKACPSASEAGCFPRGCRGETPRTPPTTGDVACVLAGCGLLRSGVVDGTPRPYTTSLAAPRIELDRTCAGEAGVGGAARTRQRAPAGPGACWSRTRCRGPPAGSWCSASASSCASEKGVRRMGGARARRGRVGCWASAKKELAAAALQRQRQQLPFLARAERAGGAGECTNTDNLLPLRSRGAPTTSFPCARFARAARQQPPSLALALLARRANNLLRLRSLRSRALTSLTCARFARAACRQQLPSLALASLARFAPVRSLRSPQLASLASL
jgi:hypothetical protein